MAGLALALLMLAGGVRAADVSVTVQDSAGKPVEDAVVFVYEADGKFAAPSEPAVVDQIDKLFVPRVRPVLMGTKIRFPNKDNIHHHVYSFSKAKKIDLPLYKGEPADPITVDKPGIVKLGCNIHDWMQGFIVVLDNPYFAKTDAAGKAQIQGLPPGSYQLALWSDRRKESVEDSLKPLKIGAEDVSASFKLKFGPRYVPKRPAVETY